MRNRLGRGRFAAVILVLVFMTVYFGAGTALSRTDLSAEELEVYYRAKEKELVECARGFLEGEGLADSGVMLTRVVDADGGREYTLTVHHGAIDRMDEGDRGALMEKLEGIVFQDERSVFNHKFFINN